MTAAKNPQPGAPGEAPEGEAGFSIAITAGAFGAAVSRACAVVPGRTTIPILSHALLRLDAFGKLHVTGSNLDQVVTAVADTTHKLVRAAAITVPAADLKDALVHLKAADTVTAQLDPAKGLLVLKQGRTTYKLPTLPEQDFPLVEEIRETDAAFAVEAAALSAALKAVEMAASSEETRFYLCGVYFDFREGCMLVCTDGHRLHKAPLPLADGAAVEDPDLGFILPSAAVRPLLAACDGGGRIFLTLGQGKLRAEAPSAKGGALRLTTRLVDGTFPDWRRVVPTDPPNRVTADAAELLAAVERVAIIQGAALQTDNSKRLTAGVKLAIADGEIALSNRHQNTGEEAETSCAASLIAGAAGEIGFNGVYLAAALRSLSGADTVEFGWTDAGGPCLLTIHAAAGTPHEGHGRVVMPMRI